MHIFDISPAKSGTTSLAMAFRILGFRACHGCPDKFERDFMARVLQDDMHFELLADFDAVCGLLNYAYFSLDAQHPDAKFVYLDRDEDDWVRSTLSQLGNNDQSSVFSIGRITSMLYARIRNIGCVHTVNPEYLRQRFRSRRENILRHFAGRPEKLLVMPITAGWEPLCEFLRRPVPDLPFPVLNETLQ